MTRWTPPPHQPNLFKTKPPHELGSHQRAMALKLLKMLLKEAISATDAEAESIDGREAGDDQ
jgi:hypothetical protein